MKKLQHFLELVSPTCERAAFLQSRQLDARLPGGTRLFLAFHLVLCRHCRRYGDHLALLSAACARYSDQIPEVSAQTLSPDARQRLEKQMQELTGGT